MRINHLKRRRRFPFGWVILALVVIAGIGFAITPIRERVLAKVDSLIVEARSVLFPVPEAAFVPQGVTMPTVTPDKSLFEPSDTPFPTAAPTNTSKPSAATATPSTPEPTSPPTATPTPIPSAVKLTGVKWESQNGAWNYCGPTNLAMLLSYWGWKGDKFTTGTYLKPFQYDYNVMPYEMVNYVTDLTKLGAVWRLGGTQDELKLLIANGFPVLVEKGVYFEETATHKLGWMGHYAVITGYDDANKQFITQDSYVQPDLPISYDLLDQEWRDFNFVFIVAYSPDKKDQLFSLLGPYADENTAYRIAYDRASKEINSLSGGDQYFAWFNRGTAQVDLQDFAGAAQSYDQSFQLLASNFSDDKRPWRMLWYQTGPYFAYFYSGRYQDVINLATSTLDYIKNRAQALGITDQPQVGQFIEETWYWRGKARLVTGDQQDAISDYKMALKYHPGFTPAVGELKNLGVPVQ